MADLATLKTRLTEAEQAYHLLQTGALEVEVDHNGSRTRYTAAGSDRLNAYIQSLKNQIAALEGKPTYPRRIGVLF